MPHHMLAYKCTRHCLTALFFFCFAPCPGRVGLPSWHCLRPTCATRSTLAYGATWRCCRCCKAGRRTPTRLSRRRSGTAWPLPHYWWSWEMLTSSAGTSALQQLCWARRCLRKTACRCAASLLQCCWRSVTTRAASSTCRRRQRCQQRRQSSSCSCRSCRSCRWRGRTCEDSSCLCPTGAGSVIVYSVTLGKSMGCCRACLSSKAGVGMFSAGLLKCSANDFCVCDTVAFSVENALPCKTADAGTRAVQMR